MHTPTIARSSQCSASAPVDVRQPLACSTAGREASPTAALKCADSEPRRHPRRSAIVVEDRWTITSVPKEKRADADDQRCAVRDTNGRPDVQQPASVDGKRVEDAQLLRDGRDGYCRSCPSALRGGDERCGVSPPYTPDPPSRSPPACVQPQLDWLRVGHGQGGADAPVHAAVAMCTSRALRFYTASVAV